MKPFLVGSSNLNAMEMLEWILDTVKKTPDETKRYAYSIFTSPDIKKFIVDANIRMLKEGKRPDGTDITKLPVDSQRSEYYERLTIYNRTKGKSGYKSSQAQFVDLYKTGFFHSSLTVESGTNELHEFSKDPKSEKLGLIWGEILGISGEDVEELIKQLRPQIINFVKKRFNVSLDIQR